MSEAIPRLVRYGALSAYVKPLRGCPYLGFLIPTFAPGQRVIWLDSARQHPITGRWSVLAFDPWLTLVARGDRIELATSSATHVWRAHPLCVLRDVLRRYRAPKTPLAPLQMLGLFGLLSYELNRWIEKLPEPQPNESDAPEMLLFGMRAHILLDHLQKRGWLISVVDPHRELSLARTEALDVLERLQARLEDATKHNGSAGCFSEYLAGCVRGMAHTSTRKEYCAMVRRVLSYIRKGDIFQANIAQRFTAAYQGAPWRLYEALRAINPSPFACYCSLGDISVISCSPERLVRSQEGRLDTRPIAGTRPRGLSPNDDVLQSLDLLLNEKERAEHTMLVDLARNDLGRVCAIASVSVDELMVLEEYSHVIHIVSEVSGLLQSGKGAVDIIRAVFPGGTITGCPKIRCMQILRQLEPVRRGIYTGSIGYLGFDGTMDLNIAIRTIVLEGERLSFHVGAGIVADSDPDREYEETLAKAAALFQAIDAAHNGARITDAVCN